MAGQANHLGAKLAQVPLDLLLLGLLYVVLGWVLQVCLDLEKINIGKYRDGERRKG